MNEASVHAYSMQELNRLITLGRVDVEIPEVGPISRGCVRRIKPILVSSAILQLSA